MIDFDILITGCGFAGATAARLLAEKGKKVLILEKREHIAGNMFECTDENGINIHLYGPHIFHTNSERAYEFITKYATWHEYRHKVLGNIDGTLVPVPFNFTSLEKLLPDKAQEIIIKLKEKYPGKDTVSILELISNEDKTVKDFGNYVYDKVFANYTAKQWGIPVEQVDNSVINRIPVVLGYRDTYFSDKYQLMPDSGFTKLFENILDHKNIKVMLKTDACKRISLNEKEKAVYFDGQKINVPVIYTGALDEFAGYKYGHLPYRSLNLCFESFKKQNFQDFAVVNYTTSEKFTRITEFKFLTGQKLKNRTTILKEYPQEYEVDKNTPYYPIINKENIERYGKYKEYISAFGNIYPCGRLAEYKYYNMDGVIEQAINLCGNIK